jgi:hypothetical protein
MKTQSFIIVFSLLLLSFSCSEKSISDKEKEQALERFTICKQIAAEWLAKLDSTNYNSVSTLPLITDASGSEVTAYIQQAQKVYGKVNSRKLLGAHIEIGRKLVTYAPEIEDKYLNHVKTARSVDGFYLVKPRYFGLRSSRQMFSKFPAGEHVLLMYQSSPTNKSYAEEGVVLWENPQGNWEIAGYTLADEI